MMVIIVYNQIDLNKTMHAYSYTRSSDFANKICKDPSKVHLMLSAALTPL